MTLPPSGRREVSSPEADGRWPSPVLFPSTATSPTTALLLVGDDRGLPVVQWCGVLDDRSGAATAGELAAVTSARGGSPLLVEHYRPSYRRPGLRGHRLAGADDAGRAGRDWSTAFVTRQVEVRGDLLTIDAADDTAALALRTEVQALPGGALRVRHVVTNAGDDPYEVQGLDVSVPLPDRCTELLDFTGRHEYERRPQRHRIGDGLWLRENRRGRTGLESATMLVAGSAGFGFGHGEVVAAHLAFSGNSELWVERDPETATTLGGGELLQPGEITLRTGESYASPWLVVAAGRAGLDDVSAALHAWQRTWPAHPDRQRVVLNVWEAVYFDHDLDRLRALAERAARIGVERFVLDDGWFRGRRDDTAGLGDWWVDATVWPQGLRPLADHVHGLGMQFGLWFEPEMVNPESDLYRAHPDWVLGAGGRLPVLRRNQVVLDLTNPDVIAFLLERIDAVLTENPVDYVKWDHNRDLLEAGSPHTGTAVPHEQTLAFYALLDELRRRHPDVEWESCASGGGRIDLGVLEHVQRVWTSDMTDALARQHIQRWTVSLVAPEYLGAHVSAPVAHQTGRTLPLDFRAATALFGAFGIEWDITQATAGELDRLADWIGLFKRFRPLLHSGRTVRIDSPDPAVWMHGVVSAAGDQALFAHVQLDESDSNRGVTMRLPGLRPEVPFRLGWAVRPDPHRLSRSPQPDPGGPTGGVFVHGAVLAEQGIWLPRRRPETVLLVEVSAATGGER